MTEHESILLVAPVEQQTGLLQRLTRAGFHQVAAYSAEELLAAESVGEFHVCIMLHPDREPHSRRVAQLVAEQISGARLICLLQQDSPWGREILPTYDCEILREPIDEQLLRQTVRGLLIQTELTREIHRLQKPPRAIAGWAITGRSAAAEGLREQLAAAAETAAPCLIEAAPGSGGHLAATEIHRHSLRQSGPCIRIDCSLFSSDGLLSELLGHPDAPLPDPDHEAVFGNPLATSRLLLAGSGTLILDYLDSAPLSVQKKLVRPLETRRLTAPSRWAGRPFEARIIGIIRDDLTDRMESGQLCPQLIDRLSRCHIRVPRLCEREADVVELAELALSELAARDGHPPRRLHADALQLISQFRWPGNLRQLHAVLERAVAVSDHVELTAADLDPWLSDDHAVAGLPSHGMSLKQMERQLIETTFARCAGNRERTAQALGIGLRTLSGKLREYGYPPRGGPGSNQHRERQRLRVA